MLLLFRFRKNRLVKPVTGLDVHNKIRDFKQEEQNMFYLRHPYLTRVNWNWINTKVYFETTRNNNQTVHNYTGRIVRPFIRTRSFWKMDEKMESVTGWKICKAQANRKPPDASQVVRRLGKLLTKFFQQAFNH